MCKYTWAIAIISFLNKNVNVSYIQTPKIKNMIKCVYIKKKI